MRAVSQGNGATRKVLWRFEGDAFGTAQATNPTATVLTMPLRMPGQYFDSEVGTSYNYFRDYDASTGRYVESDPIGLEGGLNTYGYVGGSPLAYSDPMGLAEKCKTVLRLPYRDIQFCVDDGKPTYPKNPDNSPSDFDPIKGSRGKICKEDKSVWERDSSSHGGDQWKRWPDKKSWERADTPNSVWPDGRVRK